MPPQGSRRTPEATLRLLACRTPARLRQLPWSSVPFRSSSPTHPPGGCRSSTCNNCMPTCKSQLRGLPQVHRRRVTRHPHPPWRHGRGGAAWCRWRRRSLCLGWRGRGGSWLWGGLAQGSSLAALNHCHHRHHRQGTLCPALKLCHHRPHTENAKCQAVEVESSGSGCTGTVPA